MVLQFSLKLNGNCKIKSILKDLNASSKINLNWFNENNTDMVEGIVEEHINDLLDIKDYIELNRKFNQLTLELTSNFTSEERQKFYEYQRIDLELSSYQSSLAYYIALNKK